MITSTSNPQVKYLLQLQKKSKVRNEQQVFIVEGIRMFLEVPKERVEKVYLSETFYNKNKQELTLEDISYEILSDNVFAHVSDTKTPQGILCIVRQLHYESKALLEREQVHILVLDKLQDPGNLGTILRVSEGAGVTGIVMSKDCVDIYNPKVIRSTMGSIYRVPFLYVDDTLEFVDKIKQHGVRVYAAHLEGAVFYDQEDYTKDIAFLIGNEGNGLSEELANRADCFIKIPMQGQVESLNAAIATSILVYEAYRQRR